MSIPPRELQLRHLAKIVDSSDDAIVSKDLNGIIQSWNGAAERMFGFTAAEAIGMSIRAIIPDDRQGEEDYVLGQIRGGKAVRHYETIRQRKDGSQLPISLTVSPIYDDDGQVIGASKIARDITERDRLQRQVAEQAAIADQLSQVGAIIASSLDQTTIVQQVTDLGRELTGAAFGVFFQNTSDGDAMAYTVSGAPRAAFEGAPHPRATPLFAATFDGNGPVRLDDATKDARSGNGPAFGGLPDEYLPVRSYLAVPVKASNGAVLGGLFFGHKNAACFTAHHEQLAVGVAAWATVALDNARLYREAREADRLKEEFLAVLSHELRTPLNAILGYSRLLRGGVLAGDKGQRALETLERNATALTQIVEDVLDISRIASGKIRLDVQPVDLALVARDAIATVRPAADAKGIRVEPIIDPRVGPVSGDPDRLQQVVWNLLSNAVKFTPKRGRIQVRVQRINSHVEIVISDTGAGIRPDFLPFVFDRFRQGDAGTTRKTGGLGLGLSIVRQLVELHGGSVSASSEGEGKGSTFRVTLPTMILHPQAGAEPGEHPRSPQAFSVPAVGGLDGAQIMAVDDDADALGLLRAVFETAGATVHGFNSAAEALAALETLQPHAMVVDLGMPEMDGFEFIRRVRRLANPVLAATPAAALTAFARSEDRVKALRAGFEMHLSKPVDPAELVAAIEALVRPSPFRSRPPGRA